MQFLPPPYIQHKPTCRWSTASGYDEEVLFLPTPSKIEHRGSFLRRSISPRVFRLLGFDRGSQDNLQQAENLPYEMIKSDNYGRVNFVDTSGNSNNFKLTRRFVRF